jgi:hypothetical protein
MRNNLSKLLKTNVGKMSISSLSTMLMKTNEIDGSLHDIIDNTGTYGKVRTEAFSTSISMLWIKLNTGHLSSLTQEPPHPPRLMTAPVVVHFSPKRGEALELEGRESLKARKAGAIL